MKLPQRYLLAIPTAVVAIWIIIKICTETRPNRFHPTEIMKEFRRMADFSQFLHKRNKFEALFQDFPSSYYVPPISDMNDYILRGIYRAENGTILERFNSYVNRYEVYSYNDTELMDEVLDYLGNAPIIHASEGTGGTQVKLSIHLLGDGETLVKPWRVPRDYETIPDHYYWADVERHNAEIASFHLDRILDFRRVAPTAGRILDLNDLFDRADDDLKATFYRSPENNFCFMTNCTQHCDNITSPVCGNPDKIEVSVAVYLTPTSDIWDYDNPFTRSYHPAAMSHWEINPNYCKQALMKQDEYNNTRLLLDVIDMAIFDFLIGNLDRHSYFIYQEFDNKSSILHLDNGRGFGKYKTDYISGLAAIIQCCVVRRSTYERLLILQTDEYKLGDVMRDSMADDNIAPVLYEPHYEALNRRLDRTIKEIDKCLHDADSPEDVLKEEPELEYVERSAEEVNSAEEQEHKDEGGKEEGKEKESKKKEKSGEAKKEERSRRTRRAGEKEAEENEHEGEEGKEANKGKEQGSKKEDESGEDRNDEHSRRTRSAGEEERERQEEDEKNKESKDHDNDHGSKDKRIHEEEGEASEAENDSKKEHKESTGEDKHGSKHVDNDHVIEGSPEKDLEQENIQQEEEGSKEEREQQKTSGGDHKGTNDRDDDKEPKSQHDAKNAKEDVKEQTMHHDMEKEKAERLRTAGGNRKGVKRRAKNNGFKQANAPTAKDTKEPVKGTPIEQAVKGSKEMKRPETEGRDHKGDKQHGKDDEPKQKLVHKAKNAPMDVVKPKEEVEKLTKKSEKLNAGGGDPEAANPHGKDDEPKNERGHNGHDTTGDVKPMEQKVKDSKDKGEELKARGGDPKGTKHLDKRNGPTNEHPQNTKAVPSDVVKTVNQTVKGSREKVEKLKAGGGDPKGAKPHDKKEKPESEHALNAKDPPRDAVKPSEQKVKHLTKKVEKLKREDHKGAKPHDKDDKPKYEHALNVNDPPRDAVKLSDQKVKHLNEKAEKLKTREHKGAKPHDKNDEPKNEHALNANDEPRDAVKPIEQKVKHFNEKAEKLKRGDHEGAKPHDKDGKPKNEHALNAKDPPRDAVKPMDQKVKDTKEKVEKLHGGGGDHKGAKPHDKDDKPKNEYAPSAKDPPRDAVKPMDKKVKGPGEKVEKLKAGADPAINPNNAAKDAAKPREQEANVLKETVEKLKAGDVDPNVDKENKPKQ